MPLIRVSELHGQTLTTHESPQVYTVTVAAKTSAHPQYQNGSDNGFYLDLVEAPFLHLVPGTTYKFDQSDSSNDGHPLVFYYEEDKSTSFITNVTTNGTPGTSGAYTQIVVDEATPALLYYQCSAHQYMGWGMEVSTHNMTNFDTDDLSEGSTNRYYTSARFNTDFATKDTDDLPEGSTNRYFDQALARIAISASGDLSYDSSTGVMSFTETAQRTDAQVNTLIDNRVDAAFINALSIDADTLGGQDSSYHLNYNNFTNRPSSILDFGIADGTSGQVLQTDGLGNFSFTTQIGAGSGNTAGYSGFEDYYYNVSSDTTTFGTTASTHDKVQVFLNGVLLDDSDISSFDTSTGIVTLAANAISGDEVTIWAFNNTDLENHETITVSITGDATIPGYVDIGDYRQDGSKAVTLSSTTPTNVGLISSNDFLGAKLTISVVNNVNSDSQITEALILTDNAGTDPLITTYGTLYSNTSLASTGGLASFDAVISANTLALEVTCASADSTTIRIAYTAINT